ncbi:MAG: diaminopimelate decarboxylase, partial [Clostridia bacterium]|nr:diaminopimelate decarboxylase [Clostridia bacterium]
MTNKTAPSKETLEKIIEKIPTPFHLYSEERLLKQVRGFLKAFSWNKKFKEYYAVKACPTPAILKILKDEGCGVDCASECELMLAEALGFKGDEIMFSSNETPRGEFAYAARLGAIINLDDYTLIDSLIQEGGVPERVCLRFNPGGEFKLGTFVMGNPGDAKYGMTRKQLSLAVSKLMKMGVKEFALHAFLASNTTDNTYYPTMARLLMTVAKELKEELGAKFFMINLSGGVGIPYRPEQSEADIFEIGEGVRQAFEDICVPNGMED